MKVATYSLYLLFILGAFAATGGTATPLSPSTPALRRRQLQSDNEAMDSSDFPIVEDSEDNDPPANSTSSSTASVELILPAEEFSVITNSTI